MACNFSSLIWPDGSAAAALASLLFDPPEPQIIRKTQCFAIFSHLHLLSSDSFSSLILSLLLFSSLTLPTSAFPSVHIVGSLTSKLPSVIYTHSYTHLYTVCHHQISRRNCSTSHYQPPAPAAPAVFDSFRPAASAQAG